MPAGRAGIGAGELEGLRAELARVVRGLADVLEELREIARGIHPAVLTEGGLAPALRSLARRSPIPVALQIGGDGRLPEQIDVAVYYVISEMLTNAAKHARAPTVEVDVHSDGMLSVTIRDDGLGGADPSRGSGLIGLKDRVEAIGGSMHVESQRGSGTLVQVRLPNPSA